MDEIRIGLIVVGIFALVAIYAWEQRYNARNKQAKEQDPAIASDTPLVTSISGKSGGKPGKKESRQEYLVLYVNAPSGQFKGGDIRVSLSTQGLRFSPKNSVYEFPITGEKSESSGSLFSVANMVNPGLFPDGELADFNTIGLAFVMVLPVQDDPQKAFAKMLQVANQVAGQLHGRLLDHNRNILTKQGINYMREKVLSVTYQDTFVRRNLP
jgi:cell division protein ZipA